MAHSPKRRLLFMVLLCAIIALLILPFWTISTSPDGKRPSTTRRALASTQSKEAKQRANTVRPDHNPSKTSELGHQTLWIHLSEPGQWRYPGSTGYKIGPQDYWPMEDEAPWPDLESADALQDLAEVLRGGEGSVGKALHDFIEQAQDDGLMGQPLDDMLTDPWSGLVAMQAEYANTFLHSALFPEQETVDFRPSINIAQAITEKWPDDPAAEYARLQLLQVANESGSIDYDPEEALDMILDIIDNTEDPLVLDVAIGEFTALGHLSFDDDTIAQIASVYDEIEVDMRRGIIRAMLNHHTQTQDWEQVDLWSERLIEHEDLVQWDDNSLFSTNTRSVLSDLAGFRAVQEGREPTNWREELSVVVHLCHEDAPLERSTGGKGRWNNGWQWQEWWDLQARLISRSTPDPAEPPADPVFINCVKSHQWSLPPPGPISLTLKVLR